LNVLETARLQLRRVEHSDAPFILQLVNDPEWLRHIGDKNVHNLDDARRYVDDGPLTMYARNGHGLWLVALRDGTAIGLCGLIKRDSLEDVDIGYALLPAYRGRGYAREAAAACLAYGFDTLKLPRIVAITAPDNLASGLLLESIGLRYQGLLPSPGEADLKLYAAASPSAAYQPQRAPQIT
jgi:RimJ/RimL family protein N-acetyltransferase